MHLLMKSAVLVAAMISMAACCQVYETGKAGLGTTPEGTWVREELYFGADIPGGGSVSDSLWENFEQTEIVTRFPNGFTTASATGRYKYGDGRIAKESTRIVIIYYQSINRDEEIKIDEIISVYKKRFKQEAVLRTRTHVAAKLQ